MRKLVLLAIICSCITRLHAQVKIGNNPNTINQWSLLELESTNKGLLLPRLTNSQMQTLGTVAPDGMIIFNTDNKALYIMRSSQFVRLADTTRTISFPYTAIVNSSGNGFTMNNNGSGNAITGNATGGDGITGTSNSGNGGSFSSSTGNALVTLQGNVGIGTGSPNYQLDVNGRMRIRYNGFTAGLWLNKSDNSEGSFIGHYNDSTFGIYGPGAAGGWKFFYNFNSTRMGIGNSNPSASLYVVRGTGVNGTAVFEGTTNSSHFNYSTTEDTYIRGGKSDSKVIINDLSTGFIGMFTSSPTYPLTVKATANGIVQTDGTVAVGSYIGGGYGWLQTYSNHPLAFTTNNSSVQMILATGGNVGIGVLAPSQKLDIGNGRLRFTGALGQNAASGIEFTNIAGNALRGFLGQRDDNNIGFYGFAGSGWSFNHNVVSGNTGIGTDAGTAKLTVEGGSGNALEISGGIKVSGNKAAFVLTCSASNLTDNYNPPVNYVPGNNYHAVYIDNALSNGDPNAMIFVTPIDNPIPFAVTYDNNAGKWKIKVNSAGTSETNCYGLANPQGGACGASYVAVMPYAPQLLYNGNKFNVMIIKQ